MIAVITLVPLFCLLTLAMGLRPSQPMPMQFLDAAHPSDHHFPCSHDQANLAPPRNLPHDESRPIPTNNWWGNLIHQSPLGGSKSNEEEPIQPVWAHPYALRVLPGKGLAATYSFDHRQTGPPNPDIPGNPIKYYFHGIVDDIILAADDVSKEFVVQDWDDFGVQIALGGNKGGRTTSQQQQQDATMVSHLVSGMAFVSATYVGLTPSIESIHALVSINGTPAAQAQAISVGPGSKLVLEYNSGQHWAVYSDGRIEFRCEANRLVANSPIENPTTVRVAKIDPNHPEGVQVFDRCAKTLVLGGCVEILSDKRYNLRWKTTGGDANAPLLHYALPHHAKSFVQDPPPTIVTAESSTKGSMCGICHTPNASGDVTWELHEPEDIPVDFGPTQCIDPDLVREFSIDQHLRDELEQSWEIPLDGSYYFNGKKMQQYASLCLMAHDDALNQDPELRDSCLAKLAKLWDIFVASEDDETKFLYPLVYDDVYKGIVTCEGFCKQDPGVDFGNTVYNDHHYHYGYWIVGAAMFLKLHPDYPHRVALEGRIEALLRDVANPSQNDPCFPRFRHFDWYLGHSYSHGVTPMGDGKDQESVSEEMNLHYGIALWGKLLQNQALEHLGRLLLKVDARAIQTYFLLTQFADDGKVHPPEFRPNKVTGILFDNKADCTTWFSPDRSCIHGIQMIPVSPMAPLVRPLSFVQEEWDSILSHLPMIQDPKANPNPWQSLLFANYARLHPRTALEHLTYVPMDDGLSRAWALYMGATTTS